MTGMKRIRLVVIDDHPMVRQGIRMFVAGDPMLSWAGEAATGQEGLELCRLVEPDVVLMDMHLPDQTGLAVTRLLLGRRPDLPVILVSGQLTEEIHREAQSLGVRAVLHKEAQAHEICQTIHRCGSAVKGHSSSPDSLTPRELEVLGQIGRGASNPEIVERLSISEKTVKVHITHILAKLGLETRVQAALYAVRHGIGVHR